jgi:dehydrodolichyl diphosphate syntase complex subunit NUS1
VVNRIPAIINSHYSTSELIQKDIKGLSRLPEHLSVIVSLRNEDDALQRLMDEVAEIAAWSACARISTLSVYEKNGLHIF